MSHIINDTFFLFLVKERKIKSYDEEMSHPFFFRKNQGEIFSSSLINASKIFLNLAFLEYKFKVRIRISFFFDLCIRKFARIFSF